MLEVLKTESRITKPIKSLKLIRALHAVMGLSTEVGELLDAFKKHIFYGKPLDKVNIEEEIGDIFWYLFVLMDVYKLTSFEVKQRNIDKLKTRYKGGKFSKTHAVKRNLRQERKTLQGK